MEIKINILLVEDNPADARLIDIYLKEGFGNSFVLSVCDSMFETLALLSKTIFDVIILDLSLPDSNGLETFTKVYKHSPEIPIVVLTGLEDESMGINAMKLGAQDFKVKDKVKGEELKRSINYSIERSNLKKELFENTKKLESQKKLEEIMEAKEQFLANMSHEIRTPMNAIVGFTDLISKTKLSPDQQKYIDAIKISGENLLVIINDILDYSKIQSRKLNFEQIDLSLSAAITTVYDLMLPKSIEKDILLSTNIDKNIPDNLMGDPVRLNQILLNLVGNAIKFTEKGEVKIGVDLIQYQDNTVELEFAITDTGIGIAQNKLALIFEGFTQASDETTRKYGGSGLGLSIVKQLVELQGGSVSAQSHIGEGSIFKFKLKFKKNLNPKAEVKNSIQDEQRAAVEGLNVLLVEDNLLNQILAEKVLSDWKWNVSIAEDGKAALEKVGKNKFDVILMDIQLPEMDGYQVTRHIRQDFAFPKCDTPILAMTAHALAGEAKKCQNAGMNDYISKPFNAQVLYSKIISILHSS